MDPIWIHFGIVRTGSSTMRQFIRDYSKEKNKICRPFQELKNEPGANLADFVFVESPYAVHKELDRSSMYVTTIRNPVESIVSEYYFYLEKNELDPSYSLDDYLAELPFSYNKQSRWIAAIGDEAVREDQPRILSGQDFFDDIEDDALMQKVQTVAGKYFKFIGVLEHFPESAFLLSQHLNWDWLPILRRMNASVRSSMEEQLQVSELQRHLIMESNKVDMALYNAVMQNIQAQINAMPDNLKHQLVTYRDMCRKEDESFLASKAKILEENGLISQ